MKKFYFPVICFPQSILLYTHIERKAKHKVSINDPELIKFYSLNSRQFDVTCTYIIKLMMEVDFRRNIEQKKSIFI